jgi:hypothetical protein
MADNVHVNNTDRRSPDWIWVLIAVIVVGLIAWFLIGRGGARTAGTDRTDINIEVPTAPAPGGTGETARPAGPGN